MRINLNNVKELLDLSNNYISYSNSLFRLKDMRYNIDTNKPAKEALGTLIGILKETYRRYDEPEFRSLKKGEYYKEDMISILYKISDSYRSFTDNIVPNSITYTFKDTVIQSQCVTVINKCTEITDKIKTCDCNGDLIYMIQEVYNICNTFAPAMIFDFAKILVEYTDEVTLSKALEGRREL